MSQVSVKLSEAIGKYSLLVDQFGTPTGISGPNDKFGLLLGTTNPTYLPNILGGAGNAAADTIAIQAAALAAFNAGGGVVQLPAVSIYLTAALPIYNGVFYQGAGWVLNPGAGSFQIPDGQGTSLSSGTILNPVTSGTIDAFDFNSVDAGSDPYGGNQGAASRAMAYGFGISNLAMQNFAYGIKIGAKYTAGGCYCKFSNLIAINCTQWGFWFENMLHPVFDTLRAYYCKVGQMMFVHSGNSVAAYNGDYYDLLGVTDGAAGNLERGVCFWSRNNATSGMGYASVVQCNRYNNNLYTSPASVSITAATPGVVSVPDLSVFAVGMPVVLNKSGTATGTASFNATQTYWVASVSGSTGAGTITLANSNFGTALTNATAVSGLTISTYGFSGIEITARDAGSNISLYVYGPDTEGGGTSKLEIQNATNTHIVGQILSNGQSLNDIIIRGSAGVSIENTGNGSIDNSVGDAATTSFITNLARGAYTGSGAKTPGLYFDAVNANRNSLNLANNWMPGSTNPSFFNMFNAGGFGVDATGVGVPIYNFVQGNYANTSLALSFVPAGGAGVISYTGATSTTWTMPTITAGAEGLEWCIANSGSAAAVLTLSAGTSQFFNLSTRGSITIAIGASITLVARYNGGTAYWQVKGIGGVYSAGAITSM